MPAELPWARVRNPVPLPAPRNPRPLLQLDDAAFAELIRSHLMPREEQPGGRKLWTQMWAMLAGNRGLAERTFDALEDFLDTTEEAIKRDQLDDAELSRAVKFKRRCEEAWTRLQRVDDDRPLAWAGKAGDGFNPAATKVISTLIGAISRHRSAILRNGLEVTPEDQALWDSMREVDLDPRNYSYRERS